jgi:hypothetical protein
MAKTVIGLFDTRGEVDVAIDELLRFGVSRDAISVVSRDERGDSTSEVSGDAAAEGAGAGAVGGTLVGGALGLLVGTGLLVIPGIGPVLAAGPLAASIGSFAAAAGATALGAGLGAAAGGLLGGLMGVGVPEDEAEVYVEGVRRGGTLLSVQVTDVEADDVREILLRNGAVDMSRRSDEWRAGGWSAGTDNSIDTRAVNGDLSIPRGDSYAIDGQQTRRDYEESSKLGTASGAAAGAATGAAIGAAGGPAGAAIGGVAGAAVGAGAGAVGDVAGERAEEGDYRFRDNENLTEVDRQVVDTSYTNVDRTGERVKSSGFESGHAQPREHEPEAFGEWLDEGERAFRTPEDTRRDSVASGATAQGGAALGPDSAAPYRPDGYNSLEDSETSGRADTAIEMGGVADNDLISEGGRRSPQYAGANEMGGAIGNMGQGDGSSQPGRMASGDLDRERRVRIYDRPDSPRTSDDADDLPAHGDFARGMRDEAAPAVEPDFARGMHTEPASNSGARTQVPGEDPGAPHHGDFARGMRDEEARPVQPDYARGQRSFENYDQDFVAHHRSMTGAGGQPYDYYKPGYQFGYDMANDRAYNHESWELAERDARQSWEREARGSWEEFKDAIRYGWEKARGRAS